MMPCGQQSHCSYAVTAYTVDRMQPDLKCIMMQQKEPLNKVNHENLL